MTVSSQKRAIKNYRKRLSASGMARFEVLARDSDRELIRALAKQLAADGPQAARLRATVAGSLDSDAPRKGGILRALRRSPLVGADVVITRSFESGRTVEL